MKKGNKTTKGPTFEAICDFIFPLTHESIIITDKTVICDYSEAMAISK